MVFSTQDHVPARTGSKLHESEFSRHASGRAHANRKVEEGREGSGAKRNAKIPPGFENSTGGCQTIKKQTTEGTQNGSKYLVPGINLFHSTSTVNSIIFNTNRDCICRREDDTYHSMDGKIRSLWSLIFVLQRSIQFGTG